MSADPEDDPRGFTEDEIRWGEDQASHLPKWGCALLVVVLFFLIGLAMFKTGFFMHGDR